MTMIAYKFKVSAKQPQHDKILETISLCRWLYNSALEQRVFMYKNKKESLSFYTQKRELPSMKKELPIFKTVHSQVLQNVLERLDKAYQSFFNRLKKGEKGGFPRFQGSGRYRSFTYPQSGFSLKGNVLTLSKIGDVRIHRHRKIKGIIKTCTISHKNGSFYVSFTCEIERAAAVPSQKAVGIDLGIKHLAITSDGEFFQNPKHLWKEERKLKKLQRAVSKKRKGSHRRKKAVQLLAKHHEHIANMRQDTAHKVSRQLVTKYDVIVFENLHVQKMIRNHRLAKSIADSAWRQLVDFTTYKAENAGKEVRLVNPYNTSQTCSSCGTIVQKELKDRVHECPCGYIEDRDVNAAKNILHLGMSLKNAV